MRALFLARPRSPKAQNLRKNLRKGGLPIFYRVMALAFSCVAFSLIASTGSTSCARAAAASLMHRDAPMRAA